MNAQKELIGLVLAGGESRRMGTDKSLISYHGKPQREHLYLLLEEFCREVYISCKKHQSESIPSSFKTLVDEQDEIGPIAALLTAFHKFPNASFLLIACDYPLIGREDIQWLLKHRAPELYGVSFINPETGIPEALLGIYEQRCKNKLEEEALQQHYSLRFFIQNLNFTLIPPLSREVIQSIDTAAQRNAISPKMGNEEDISEK